MKTFERGGASTCARGSERAADRDVRLPEKRPGAGLIAVLCTNYGQHERRRSRTRQDGFELLALELAKRGHRCGSEVATSVNGAFQAADGREFRERGKTVEFKTSQSGSEANNFTWSRGTNHRRLVMFKTGENGARVAMTQLRRNGIRVGQWV